MPPPSAANAKRPVKTFAYLELQYKVKIVPEDGELAATAVLAPNSFIIDPACKLSGAFAFYSWFGDNPHSGEFVLTLGGYPTDFTPPRTLPQGATAGL